MIIISDEEKIEIFYFDGHKPDEDKWFRRWQTSTYFVLENNNYELIDP